MPSQQRRRLFSLMQQAASALVTNSQPLVLTVPKKAGPSNSSSLARPALKRLPPCPTAPFQEARIQGTSARQALQLLKASRPSTGSQHLASPVTVRPPPQVSPVREKIVHKLTGQKLQAAQQQVRVAKKQAREEQLQQMLETSGQGLPPPAQAQVSTGASPAPSGSQAQANGTHSPEKASQLQQPASKRRKADKDPVLAAQKALATDIQMAAKEGDAAAGLQAYERGVAAGIKMQAHLYDTLLYLCAGGDNWEKALPALLQTHSPPPVTLPSPVGSPPQSVRAVDNAIDHSSPVASQPAAGTQQNGQQTEGLSVSIGPAAPPADGTSGVQAANGAAPVQVVCAPEEVMVKSQRILGGMRAIDGRPVSEMAFTALARMAAAAGKPHEALATAQELLRGPQTPRLRTFVPALKAFAACGDVAGAFEVDALLQQLQLDLTEAEFAALLLACAHGSNQEAGERVLQRMGRELTTLSDTSLAVAAAFFESAQRWQVQRCWVDVKGAPLGIPACSQDCLQAIDLDEAEWQAFAEGIAGVAMQREKRPDDFQKFKGWVEKHGPHRAIIDGANVALFGQNFDAGGFSFAQIQAVLQHVRQQHPHLKPLVVLHSGRAHSPIAKQPENQKFLKDLKQAHELYLVPQGSNDDWYWIYAAVSAGAEGLLMSNDEMRDHIFQLLAPKYFHKWKQRHQVRYKLQDKLAEFTYPAPYTTCTQRLMSGSYMLPAASSDLWLCASLRGDEKRT